MKHYLLAERYATGLLKALPLETLDDAAEGMRQFRQAFRQHDNLRLVLSNPVVDTRQREAVLDDVLDKLHAPGAVHNLLHALLRRGRITLIHDVVQVFSQLADEAMNRANVAVTTAKALTPEQEQRLSAAIAQYNGKEVRCDFEVEPRILGGVIVRYGDTLIDGSIRARINRLRDSLLPEERVVE